MEHDTIHALVLSTSWRNAPGFCRYVPQMGADEPHRLVRAARVRGEYPGRDVVEIYYTAPYTKGGIEKSSVVLAAFNKTNIIYFST